ncbi:hypothetical protein G7Y89_g835 [Cudoniella acicularis]|uniref:N-acetyltransferase domain-containing protein n=1 Tax=Cudoniella acicularis TaxID=354080 RepID=A0A8H4W7Y9_9HELO|nr:hypothetical protein G7Y89_g835 [Cudoniella acicularis]
MGKYAAESSRLLLQSVDIDEHFQAYHEIQSDSRAMEWSTKKPSATPEETLALMREQVPTPEKPWNQRWAILLRPGEDATEQKPKMIGLIGFPREADIGYKIHPDFWGKGYMSEALALFIELFWKLDANKKYNRLIAAADPENKASTRVLEIAGFQKGEYKKDFYERGVNIDKMGFDAETPRLWLERVSEKHLQDFHEIWSSEETMIWSLRAPMKTLTDSQTWLQQSFTAVNPHIDKYAILLRPSFPSSLSPEAETETPPKMIGLIGTIGIGTEMVYMLHHSYWIKGFLHMNPAFWTLLAPFLKILTRLTIGVVLDTVAGIAFFAKLVVVPREAMPNAGKESTGVAFN